MDGFFRSAVDYGVSGQRACGRSDNQRFSDSLRLDVRHNPLLERIDWYSLANEEVDLSGLSRLRYVDGHESRIKRLLLRDCPALEWLRCAGGRSLEMLDVRSCTSLREIDVIESNLASLDLGETPHLQRLNLFFNKIAALDLSGNPALEEFWCQQSLEEIDLSHNPVLREVNVSGSETITFLDLTQNPLLESVWGLYCPKLEAVYLSNSAFFSVDPATKVYVNGERVF